MALAEDGNAPFVENIFYGYEAAVLKDGHDVGVTRIWGHGHLEVLCVGGLHGGPIILLDPYMFGFWALVDMGSIV